jgi:hypothetical protein
MENNAGCGRLELRKGRERKEKIIFGCEDLAEGSVTFFVRYEA